jgi:putative spermidine/putrescine transport system permease protein
MPTIELPDHRQLARAIKRSQRRRRVQAWLLLSPLLAFLILNFVGPIAFYLFRSVDNHEISSTLPLTLAALDHWNGEGLPSDDTFTALANDLAAAKAARNLGPLARRLNYNIVGFRDLILGTALKLQRAPSGSARQMLIDADQRWDESQYWLTIKMDSSSLTPLYLLSSLDLKRTPSGGLVRQDPPVFIPVFLRTFEIAGGVTLLCLFLGFPLAYVLASLTTRTGNLLLILVLIPFWTSLLVRTSAWVILLQTNGPLNDFLMWTGLTAAPVQLMFNRFGVYIAMSQILLPFMILPIYAVMKTIPPDYMRAAASLGAPPLYAFYRVYLPQTLPGIAAGGLLVFILALGYYITPALVGGAGDQMISYFIAFYTNQTINWGQAAALGVWLVVLTLGAFLLFARMAGKDRLRFS